MISTELKKRVTDAVAHYIDVANRHYKPSIPFRLPTIKFDLRGRTAGQAEMRAWTVNFNTILLNENVETFMARTVPHEVAHLIDLKHVQQEINGDFITVGYSRRGRRKISKHGPTWQSVMRVFGVKDISRCHKYDVTNASTKKRTRYVYQCVCKKEHKFGPKVHNIIQAGNYRGYFMRCCRVPFTAVNWMRGTPVVTALLKPAPVVVVQDKPVLNTVGMSRQQIVNMIVRGADPSAASKDIIRQIVVETGMSPAGASTYYYNARKALTSTQQAA